MMIALLETVYDCPVVSVYSSVFGLPVSTVVSRCFLMERGCKFNINNTYLWAKLITKQNLFSQSRLYKDRSNLLTVN